MMSVEEHQAVLHGLMRRYHEDLVAEIREWAEAAEAEDRAAAARQHREHLARLDAMPKPWETGPDEQQHDATRTRPGHDRGMIMSEPLIADARKTFHLVEDALTAEDVAPDIRERIMNRLLWGDPLGPILKPLPIGVCPECKAERAVQERTTDVRRVAGTDVIAYTVEVTYRPCGHQVVGLRNEAVG